MTTKLILPDSKIELQYWDYITEWKNSGDEIVPSSSDADDRDFATWLEDTRAIADIETCPTHLVPADTYFLVDETGRIIGAINIRHQLNDYLYKFGGNIGYGIRPSERRKGYATTMLKLGLEKCRALGMEKVLITCDKSNTASAQTIIANGGVLENEVLHDGEVVQRYWIKL